MAVKMSIFSLMFCTRFLLFFLSTDCRYTFENGNILFLEIVNLPILEGAVLRTPSYDVYISQLIQCARVCIMY